MTDEERIVSLDLAYETWTVEEMHDYFEATGTNPVVVSAKIDAAVNADLMDLVRASMGEDGEFPEELAIPAGWQPLNLLGLDPYHVLGFAWIPARREQSGLTFEEFRADVRGDELLTAFVEAITAVLPSAQETSPEEAAAPLADSSPTPQPTSPDSQTKSSSPTSSSSRSGKSARSGTTSSRR